MDDIQIDDIQTRLQEASKNCLEAHKAWEEKKGDKKLQEELHVAIHELRKVSSRLEIDLAVSERDQTVSKPLPIPAHRSANKGPAVSILDQGAPADNAPIVQKSAPRRRRPAPRKQGE